jgi:hypothetical protein
VLGVLYSLAYERSARSKPRAGRRH